MRCLTSISIAILLGIGGIGASLHSQEADPDDLWVSAFGWLQTGTTLAEAEQWPLALGSFIESHRQIEIIANKHPTFEPEIISYRREMLESQIKTATENLQPGEHEIMRKYLDFIDSYEEGLRLRFADEFVKALDTLDIAKVLLDEIIFERPDKFREAVETQYQLLHSSIEWLDSQINFKERTRPAVFVGDGVDWGTTQYVGERDLPGERGNLMIENSLFPGGTSSRETPGKDLESAAVGSSVSAVKPAGAVASETSSGVNGLPAFRMSSKQSAASSLSDDSEGD